MGNQSLKTAFKGHLKNEYAEEMSFHMNAEFLFENGLINLIYDKVKKEKVQGEFEVETTLKETNNQVNAHLEDILTKKLIAEIHQNITAGFSSPEANIEYLKDPNFEKHFSVYCPTEVSDFTLLQQKKFFILYNLYVEKYKEAKKEGAGFFDFVRRFFEEKDSSTDSSEALQISLQCGLKFSIHLLKEIQGIQPSLLKSSLKYLYENFRNASPLSLYGISKTFFVSDQAINEARDFLTQIIEKSKDEETKELSLKMILVLGIMRSNVEDFVHALNLIEKNSLNYDISEEIGRINFDIEESALNPRKFQEIEKVKQDINLFYIKQLITDETKSLTKNLGFTTDGQYFYLHIKNYGLFKIGNGESGDQMAGKVYAHKSYRNSERCKLLYLNGRILVRSSAHQSKALFILDPTTLEELSDLSIISDKSSPVNLEWKDDKESNRYMGITPLFTESNFLYCISCKKPEKGMNYFIHQVLIQQIVDDEEEEEKEEAPATNTQVQSQQDQQQQINLNQNLAPGATAPPNANPSGQIAPKKKSDDNTQYHYVIEVYDLVLTDIPAKDGVPAHQGLKIKPIRQIPLLKDKDNPVQKPRLILKRASFVTNGKLCMMVYKRNMHFFDLATGLRLSKSPIYDDYNSEQDGVVTYDVYNHRLWYLNRKDKELYSFICPNFKRVVKEESEFQLIYLKKRIQAIRKKDLPQTKSVKERQMDKVLAALGIQPIKSVLMEDSEKPFDTASIDENKFLIMSLLADSSANLERERPQIKWNPKKYEEATERLLTQFKSPFSTNLTPFFFGKLSQLLDSYSALIDQPKTTRTLEQQYSFFFTLKVLKSNLISLTICEIDLKDVVPDEEIYNRFYQQFKNTVVRIIEKGFNKEFANEEIRLLWKEIYDECLLSMSMGLGMIYNSFQEINSILKNSLADLSNSKNREYALLVITNFARHETIRKLVNNEQNLNELFTLLHDIMKIQTDQALQAINQTSFPNSYSDLTKSDLQQAVYQFIYRFCEKFLVFYTEYKDQSLQQKKYMEKFVITLFNLLSQQCSQITSALQGLLMKFYQHLKSEQDQETSKHQEVLCKQYCQKILGEVTNVYQLLSLYVSTFSTMEVDVAVMSPVSNSIITLIEVLSSFFVEVKAVEKSMEKVIKPTFVVETSHPYTYEVQTPITVQCKGAESFVLVNSSQTSFPPMDFLKGVRVVDPKTGVDLFRISSDTGYTKQVIESKNEVRIEFDIADIKKQKLEYLIGHPVPDCYGIKLELTPSFGSELLTLNDYLDQVLRSCTWLIGRFAYSLIRIRKVDKETDEEKNYKLLLHSKIFSGGFENRFLHLFSKRTIKRLQELSEITSDKDLLAYFADQDKIQEQIQKDSNFSNTQEDNMMFAILHDRQNLKVDDFLRILQQSFAKTVVWGNVGGMTGERLVRAAFAPMIKFSNLSSDFITLVDEYNLELEMNKDITDLKEREQKSLQSLKTHNHHKYELIIKQWAVASRMRTFYQEIKKSISEAIEKKKAKLLLQRNASSFQEEQQNLDQSEIQINTSTSTSAIDTTVNDEISLERTQSALDYDKVEKDIEVITLKIIEKSEFLLRLSIPEVWEQGKNQEADNQVVLMRTTSEIADQRHKMKAEQESGEKAPSDSIEDENQNNTTETKPKQVNTKEWKKKLHQWRMMQQSKGVIKSMDDVGSGKIFDSLSGSVLATLQSAISLKRLKKQVEQVYLNASQRVAGLKLMGVLMNKEIPHLFDLINWFCSALRGNSNHLVHYLDEIRGCGKLLEQQARKNFFQIINGLLKKLVKSKDETEIRQLINSLRWDYSANDHKLLVELKVFKILRDGNRDSEKIKNLWGAKFDYKFLFKEAPPGGVPRTKEQDRKEDFQLLNKVELSKEVLDLFEFILVTSLGKSLKPQDQADKIKLKNTSKQALMPSLERIESVIDVDASMALIAQAYEIIFKELQQYVDFVQRFEGVNWKIFVRLVNRFRKIGAYFKDNQGLSAELAEIARIQDPTAVNEDYGNEYDNDNDYGNDYEGGEKEPGFVDIDAQQSNQEKEKEEMELLKFQEFYNLIFTNRLLQMVNYIASVVTNSAYASHILFNISHPSRIGTLIGILCNGTPTLKILTIKIFEHLINILPPELFEESIQIMTSGPNSNTYQAQLLEKVKAKSSLGKSNSFTKLLFNYLLAIRNKIWARKFESQGMYGVSNAIVNLLRKMFENPVWRHLHEEELKDSIKMILNLKFEEKDAILSLFGGELQGLTTGVIAQDKNENKIALLGFADQWIEDQDDQLKKNLKVPKTTMNFEQKTNKAIGLFVNETSQDNNEVLILDPQELVLMEESNNRRTNLLPIKDLLMDQEIMLNLIQEGIINLSKTNSEKMTIEELNFKILVTKIVYSLITEREEQFIDFLKQPLMKTLFQEFLNLLFTQSCKILKTPITLQLDWVEQKCFEIRRAACESKVTLIKLKELSGQVVIDKVFLTYNSQPLLKEYLDYDLVGAINFENIVDNSMRVGFFSDDDRVKTPEFMVISSTDLYTELGIKRLSEAEVVLSTELNLEEYLVFLERQERKVKGISEKPIVLLDREDFDEVMKKFKIDQIHLKTVEVEDLPESEQTNDKKIEQEQIKQAKVICEYVGLDFEKVLAMVKQIDSDFSLTSKLNGLIKDEQKRMEEERKKKQEEEEAKRLRREQAQEDEEEEKKVESSQQQISSQAQDQVQENESKQIKTITIVEEKSENQSKANDKADKIKKPQLSAEEQKARQIQKEQKDRDEMISFVMDLVQEDIAVVQKFELKERRKLEQQTAEALFKSVRGFSEATAYTEYQQSLDLLFTLYSRRMLQKILTIKFEESLSMMLNSKERKQQFKQFLKIISNEAIFVQFNTRNKKLIRKINELMKRIVIKCKQDSEYKIFLDELFQEDILKASKELIKSLKNEKSRSIRQQFSSEEKATKYSNPYFVLSVSKIFLEQCPEDLLKEDTLRTLIEQFLILAFMFNKDPELKVKIFEFVLNLLESVQKNYNRLGFKLKEQLQQMWMFKGIVEKYTFADTPESVYPRHQLLVLEILMKLLHLKKLSKKDVHSIYTKNEIILKIQRAKDVLRETNSYKLLMYLIHFFKLSTEQRTIKKSYESAHNIFNTKMTAQFRIDEIEKMTLFFDELTEIEPDTAVAITRDYEGKEILQVLFAEEIARKSLDIYDENVFIHYPCRPSTIFAFGDCYNGKLGIDMAQGQFENPTIIKKVLSKVKDIQSFNNALVIQLEDGSLYKGGYKEYWNANEKHQVKKWDKKAKFFSLGTRHTLIVNEKDQLQGEGISNAGGMGTDVYENKSWLNIRMPVKDKIVQVSCSYDFSFAISEKAQLFCAGQNILAKLNINNLNKFEYIDLGQTVKAVKVVAGFSVMALLLVKNNEQMELWSAGYNSKGALGSGENVQTKSVFSRLAYDATAIKFTDMDIYQDHAGAVTEDGELYQWGFNAFGRCGIRDRDKNLFQPQFWEPKKVEYFNDHIVKQAAVGSCHTVVLAASKKDPQRNRVYAYGREDNNGHHLACSAAEAQKDDDFIKHIKRFDHLKVYKVEAGAKCSFVCCEGEENLLSNRYIHKYAVCIICQNTPLEGPVHFTLQGDKQFTYYCQECVRNPDFQEILPRVCYAIKAPIDDIENKVWQDIITMDSNIEEGSKEFTDDFTKYRSSSDKTPWYVSFTKLTESIDEFNLTEDSYFQANASDINPLIYIRVAQGFRPKQLEQLPTIELKNYYQSQEYYGLRFSLSPDFQYTLNQQILDETKDQFNAYAEEMKKFEGGKNDEELYKFVEDYCYQNREVLIKDINPMAIELDERRFSDKLKKMPEPLKRKRLQVLLDFNKYASQLVPFIDYNTKLTLEASARLNAYFMKAKEYIMYQVKYKYQSAYVNHLEQSTEKKDIPINRLRSLRFFESGKCDHTGEYSVFGQCFKFLANKKYAPMMVNNSTDRAWNSKFIGEGSIDVGGPYRETFFEMCKELQSHALPLLIPTSNHKNDFGEHRDKWIPSSSSSSPSHMAMFEFLGALIGMSIRCSQILNLNFPSVFWKKIIDEPLDRSDLNMIDSYCLQMLDGIKNLAQTLPEKEFQEYHDQKFVTCLTDGTEIELVPGGKNKILIQENADDYCTLVMQARLNEFDKQMRAIKQGIGMVFPPFLNKLYTWKELEYKVCGKPSIDLHHLKAITKYSGCTEDDETVKRFWRVLESFSDEEKSLYLKFVWGRSRLPLVDEKFGDKHTIKLIQPPNCDQSLPIAHTCFFAIDVPKYSTEDIMREKFLYAIKFCQAIDTDGSPYEILGEQSDEDF